MLKDFLKSQGGIRHHQHVEPGEHQSFVQWLRQQHVVFDDQDFLLRSIFHLSGQLYHGLSDEAGFFHSCWGRGRFTKGQVIGNNISPNEASPALDQLFGFEKVLASNGEGLSQPVDLVMRGEKGNDTALQI